MAVNIGQISNPSILVKPSKQLVDYLSRLKEVRDLPTGVGLFVFKNKPQEASLKKAEKIRHFIEDVDLDFIDSLKLDSKVDGWKSANNKSSKTAEGEKLLSLQDLYWIYDHLQKENKKDQTKVYFHELFEGSEIVLPKNSEIPRNEQLEKRCQRLKAEQQNLIYSNMTKNVDNSRRKFPEDTISYQIKQINRHLIAIAQFIFSVLAGFAFGFVGVELLIGNLDFGFRLLLGIICALTIALAELYFLAKKLNEDLQFEDYVTKKAKEQAKTK